MNVNALALSEPPARAYHRPRLVDGLPARVLYYNFQAWRSHSIPKVSSYFVLGSTEILIIANFATSV